jgi:hypothetical protein
MQVKMGYAEDSGVSGRQGLAAARREKLGGIKDLSPTISALMLATRVGAGIAAEIGAMVVTEQVDALRMCAADPVDYLIRPRFVASVAMTLVLVVIGTAVAAVAGMFTGKMFFAVPSETFFDFRQVDLGDLSQGAAKCIAYGATIPIVSGYWGLHARGGSEGVGTATTRAVVGSSLGIITRCPFPHTCIVERHVQAAIYRNRFLDHGYHLISLGHIGLNETGITTPLFDDLNGCFPFRFPTCRNHNLGAVPCKRQGRCPPDT